MNAFIRLLYAVLIAISVVAFIGVGVYSLYAPPKEPDYSEYVSSYDYESSDYKEDTSAFDDAYENYQDKQDDYQRNVTIILLPLIAIITAVGLYFMRKPGVIGEGLALGGVATSIYAIITASVADSRPLRFVAVTFLLFGVLLIAHLRFGRQSNN